MPVQNFFSLTFVTDEKKKKRQKQININHGAPLWPLAPSRQLGLEVRFLKAGKAAELEPPEVKPRAFMLLSPSHQMTGACEEWREGCKI